AARKTTKAEGAAAGGPEAAKPVAEAEAEQITARG
ncbi:MAG: hypothetical protein RIT14_1228, partial [Pseudomonadota bacterium]